MKHLPWELMSISSGDHVISLKAGICNLKFSNIIRDFRKLANNKLIKSQLRYKITNKLNK